MKNFVGSTPEGHSRMVDAITTGFCLAKSFGTPNDPEADATERIERLLGMDPAECVLEFPKLMVEVLVREYVDDDLAEHTAEVMDTVLSLRPLDATTLVQYVPPEHRDAFDEAFPGLAAMSPGQRYLNDQRQMFVELMSDLQIALVVEWLYIIDSSRPIPIPDWALRQHIHDWEEVLQERRKRSYNGYDEKRSEA